MRSLIQATLYPGIGAIDIDWGARVRAAPQGVAKEMLIPDVKNVVLVGVEAGDDAEAQAAALEEDVAAGDDAGLEVGGDHKAVRQRRLLAGGCPAAWRHMTESWQAPTCLPAPSGSKVVGVQHERRQSFPDVPGPESSL